MTKECPFITCKNIKEVICDGRPLTRDAFRKCMLTPPVACSNEVNVEAEYRANDMPDDHLEYIMSTLPDCVK